MVYRGELRNPAALGLALQQGRVARGVSQRELAAELGLTQRWISELEAGKPGKFTDRLFEVMRATGVRLYAEIDRPDAASGAAREAGDVA